MGDQVVACRFGSVYFADDAARRVVAGTPDHLIELTAAGHKQALETGLAIRERFGMFDYVYTSGYTRTVQTRIDANALAEGTSEVRAIDCSWALDGGRVFHAG